MRHTAATDEIYGEQAALYALGALTRPEALAFEEHLAEGCAACAAALGEFDEAVSLLAWGAPEVAPPAPARAALLSRVSAEARTPRQPPLHPPAGAGGRAAPPPLPPGMLVVRAGEGEWLETPDAGVFVKILFVDERHATVTTLVRMDAGARVPAHRHRGVEQCLVLEGDLTSGVHALSAGDFNCAPPGSVHEELRTDTGALLLIVAPESYELLEGR